MKKIKLFSALVVVFINTNLFSQNLPCEEAVHGIYYHIHMDCTQDILITSLVEDGSTGTIIGGIITTYGSVFIKPGNTFVRIVPEGNNSRRRTHSTRVKSNGNSGALENHNPAFFKEVKIFPNPIKNMVTIKSDNKKIIGYELLNMYGTTIKNEQIKPINTHTFLVAEIKKGIYLLKIKFNIGTQQTKTIIKH